jgi:GTP-binding protein
MLDKVEIKVKSGEGGRGAVTFRREKFIPYGGPFGGDGGKGGDLFVAADASVNTLRAYKHIRSFKAEKGQNGMTKGKHGKNGEDLILKVPPGTLIYRKSVDGEPYLIADLEDDGQKMLVARGGRGGWGNIHFATATNQAPRIAQPGQAAEEREIILELRLIADVGIIGYPNVGKSSLLASLSAANPKIANYPFTTLEPILGVVKTQDVSFVLAEIPGLIEGASAGKGLGHNFLRHAMRTKVLIHLLDGTSISPLDDMIRVNNELSQFDAGLAKRPQVLAINKLDLPEVEARVDEFKSAFADAGLEPVFLSAATGAGSKELIDQTFKLLKSTDFKTKASIQLPPKVFHPQAVDSDIKTQKIRSEFIVFEPELERALDKFDLDDPDQWPGFYRRLEQLGINQLLASAGAKSGDTIITGNKEWIWYKDEYRGDGGNV